MQIELTKTPISPVDATMGVMTISGAVLTVDAFHKILHVPPSPSSLPRLGLALRLGDRRGTALRLPRYHNVVLGTRLNEPLRMVDGNIGHVCETKCAWVGARFQRPSDGELQG